jgi:hypothetical protein
MIFQNKITEFNVLGVIMDYTTIMKWNGTGSWHFHQPHSHLGVQTIGKYLHYGLP